MIDKIYDEFYKVPKYIKEENIIQNNISKLKRDFSNYQRKMLLEIIDEERLICELTSIDSFKEGFKLGCKLTTQIYISDKN